MLEPESWRAHIETATLKARDSGLPLPACLLLATPVVDLTQSDDSRATNAQLDGLLSASLDDPFTVDAGDAELGELTGGSAAPARPAALRPRPAPPRPARNATEPVTPWGATGSGPVGRCPTVRPFSRRGHSVLNASSNSIRLSTEDSMP